MNFRSMLAKIAYRFSIFKPATRSIDLTVVSMAASISPNAKSSFEFNRRRRRSISESCLKINFFSFKLLLTLSKLFCRLQNTGNASLNKQICFRICLKLCAYLKSFVRTTFAFFRSLFFISFNLRIFYFLRFFNIVDVAINLKLFCTNISYNIYEIIS